MLADFEVDALDAACTLRLIAREAIHLLAAKHRRIEIQDRTISDLQTELRVRMGVEALWP
jgi:hypothetical protein